MLLQDKVAIVSGIGPGMGAEVSRLFAREGANIGMAARRVDRMKDLAAELEAMGRGVVWRSTDIAKADDCQALIDDVIGSFGRVDILVNNAFHNGFPLVDVAEADLEHWRQVMDVNYWGSLNMTRAVTPHMKAQKSGRIVMINTMSVRTKQASWGAYVGSKMALSGITKVLAKELGPHGIRVNAVHPGYIWGGEGVRNYMQAQADERGVDFQVVYDETADETALKYLTTAKEIAGSVLFYASDLSLPVTGTDLDVNCGQWM